MYTDLGLLTADPAIGGRPERSCSTSSPARRARRGGALRRLLVAPEHLLPGLLTRIAREAEHARAGRPGRIRAKLNGLDDPDIIRALYDASRAGVEIDLIVRGLCTLKPGVAGLSDRIRVRGMVGRFLEHARIYHFANAGEDEYLIGSADWRSRNLRRRVEVAAPVLDPVGRRRLGRHPGAGAGRSVRPGCGPDGSYRDRPIVAVGDPATAQTIVMDHRTEEEVVWAG